MELENRKRPIPSQHNKIIFEKSFVYQVPRVWNELLDHNPNFSNIASLKVFKRHMKEYLLALKFDHFPLSSPPLSSLPLIKFSYTLSPPYHLNNSLEFTIVTFFFFFSFYYPHKIFKFMFLTFFQHYLLIMLIKLEKFKT